MPLWHFPPARPPAARPVRQVEAPRPSLQGSPGRDEPRAARGFMWIELDERFTERWFRAVGHRPGPNCPRCSGSNVAAYEEGPPPANEERPGEVSRDLPWPTRADPIP